MNVTDSSAAEKGNAEVVAVVGGTVIDGNGGTPINDGVILVEGKRIRTVGDRSNPIPPHAKQIQTTGKFVTPGLMYPTVILVTPYWPPDLIHWEGSYDEVAIEAAQLALKGGVTTVFDWTGPRDALIKARNSVNEGRAVGARIYTCGHWVGSGGPFSPDMTERIGDVREGSFEAKAYHECAVADAAIKARINALWEVNIGAELTRMPLEEVRQEVRKYVKSGIDYVTYLVNSHRLGAYDLIAFSPRVQRMIVEEAHRAGLPVQAFFATTEEGVHLALDAGADIVSPFPFAGKPMSAETLALIAQKGIFVHTLTRPTDEYESFRRQPPDAVYPGLLKAIEAAELDDRGLIRTRAKIISAGWNSMPSAKVEALRALDPASENMPDMGEGHIRGLQGLQDKGMAPMDALMAATRNVARAFKVDKDLGTLERGKLADLVVWDRNPLEDPQNYRRIHLVMKEGKVIDRDALPTQRLYTAPLVD